jgi:amino acid adenylation domain-containing protein
VSGACLHELVQDSARRHPDRPAVVDGARVATYLELDSLANQLANALVEHGVGPGDRVGLYLEKSLEALVGIYGVLKAGAGYVPLDDQAPVARLAVVARDAGLRCVVTEPARYADVLELRALGVGIDTVVLAGEHDGRDDGLVVVEWEDLAGQPSRPPATSIGADGLAYILYTSGSTGIPKGVTLSHRNALAFVEWAAAEVGVGADDRLSSHAPLHFDLSTFDLFAAALAGAAVVLVPRQTSVFPIELAKFIAAARISVWYSVPSALTLLVLHGGRERVAGLPLRAVLFAGEVFPTKYLSQLMELLPSCRFYNLYGPTETNVCTWYAVPARSDLPPALPIGTAIPGVDVRLEDAGGTPVGPGEIGEIVVRGPTVMRGYWGDRERTDAVLRVEAGRPPAYRTGDLAQEGADGNLIFRGRRDAQVKIRGHRVELGDIEAAVNALDEVVECAVLAIADDDLGTNRLKAFVVVAGDVSKADLTRRCRARLPRYMVPDEFEFRDALPKSSTGKVARRELV